jgi:hypothetical protein
MRWAAVAALLALAACAAPGGNRGGSLYGGYPTAGYGSGLGWGGGGSGDRYSPTPGVTCDRGRQVCYDRNGADVGLTREYFGRDSAESLKDDIGDHSRGDPYYSPARGVKCDLGDQLCAKKGTLSYTQTRQQFGRKPALAVQQPDGTITPKKNVSCDTASQVCTRNGEPKVDATRNVFGKKAAKDVRQDKKNQQD